MGVSFMDTNGALAVLLDVMTNIDKLIKQKLIEDLYIDENKLRRINQLTYYAPDCSYQIKVEDHKTYESDIIINIDGNIFPLKITYFKFYKGLLIYIDIRDYGYIVTQVFPKWLVKKIIKLINP